jgi:hypothetical protein
MKTKHLVAVAAFAVLAIAASIAFIDKPTVQATLPAVTTQHNNEAAKIASPTDSQTGIMLEKAVVVSIK